LLVFRRPCLVDVA